MCSLLPLPLLLVIVARTTDTSVINTGDPKSLVSVLFLISYSYNTNLYTVNPPPSPSPPSFLISPIRYAAVLLPQR